MVMFARTLLRQGFWKARNGDNGGGRLVFVKHDLHYGGIYVDIIENVAVIRVSELGIIRVFKSVRELLDFLNDLEMRRGRIAHESPHINRLLQLDSEGSG